MERRSKRRTAARLRVERGFGEQECVLLTDEVDVEPQVASDCGAYAAHPATDSRLRPSQRISLLGTYYQESVAVSDFTEVVFACAVRKAVAVTLWSARLAIHPHALDPDKCSAGHLEDDARESAAG